MGLRLGLFGDAFKNAPGSLELDPPIGATLLRVRKAKLGCTAQIRPLT